MIDYIIESKIEKLNSELIGIAARPIKIRDIKVHATESCDFKYKQNHKIFNFILGFKQDDEYYIRVYSSSLSKKERYYFELEIDIAYNGYEYIDSLVNSLKCTTISIEKSGAINFIRDTNESISLRNCIFEHNQEKKSYSEEFDYNNEIKVYPISEEEKELLDIIKKDYR